MQQDWVRCDGRGSRAVNPGENLSDLAANTAAFSRRQVLSGAAIGTLAWLSSRPSALADVVFDAHQSARARAEADEVRPVLVTIFLRGGADGLNIVVPHGDGDYLRARPLLGIRSPLDLDGFFGFHPALKPLFPLFREGQLACVHACGSNDESHSHFEAMATVECGRDGHGEAAAPVQNVLEEHTSPRGSSYGSANGGWLARHLASLPNPSGSPLRAVAFGNTMPESLRGATNAMCLESLSDFHLAMPDSLSRRQKPVQEALRKLYGGHQDEIADAGRQTLDVLHTVNQLDPAHYKPRHGAVYPTSSLGEGLKQVACLLRARAGLEVACLDSGGWDTHIAQGAGSGWMASLLTDLAGSTAAFSRDLGPEMRRVTVLILSEFGRRVGENSGLGTDHGRAGAMLVLGGPPDAKNALRGGKVYGRWPGLTDAQLDGPGDLRVTTDYRDVLAEIVAKRLKNPGIEAIFPGHKSQTLGMVSV